MHKSTSVPAVEEVSSLSCCLMLLNYLLPFVSGLNASVPVKAASSSVLGAVLLFSTNNVMQAIASKAGDLDLCICAIANSRNMLVTSDKDGLDLSQWKQDLEGKVSSLPLYPMGQKNDPTALYRTNFEDTHERIAVFMTLKIGAFQKLGVHLSFCRE